MHYLNEFIVNTFPDCIFLNGHVTKTLSCHCFRPADARVVVIVDFDRIARHIYVSYFSVGEDVAKPE